MNWWAHETSTVENGAKIGEGTRVWQNCIVMNGAEIGKNCNLGANVFVENGVKLGNGVKVKNNIALYSGVECEDDVFLGPNCVFTNVINPRAFISRKEQFAKTKVGVGATIGANVTIICGHTIGRYALIAAGAVVTNDVRAYELVGGNPAKHMGYVCKCGVTLQEHGENYRCPECGSMYQKVQEDMEPVKM